MRGGQGEKDKVNQKEKGVLPFAFRKEDLKDLSQGRTKAGAVT